MKRIGFHVLLSLIFFFFIFLFLGSRMPRQPQAQSNPPTPLHVIFEGTLYEGLGTNACYEGVSYGGHTSQSRLNMEVTVNPTPEPGSGSPCVIPQSVDYYDEEERTLKTICYKSYLCSYTFNNNSETPERTFTFTFSPPNIIGDPDTYRPYQKYILASDPVITPPYCSIGGTNTTYTLRFDENGELTEEGDHISTDSGKVEIKQDIIFTNRVPWVKLKNASYAGHANVLNSIPWNVSAFDDNDDIQTNGGRIFSSDTESGVSTTFNLIPTPVVSPGDQEPTAVPGLYVGSGMVGQKRYDSNHMLSQEWINDDYSFSSYESVSLFFEYVKSRKQLSTFTDPGTLSTELDESGIYRLGSDETEAQKKDLTITSSNVSAFDNKRIMLYVTGKLKINVATFDPTDGYAILLAPEVEFGSNAKEVHGVVIGHVVSVSKTSSLREKGLKIVGNLVSTEYFVNNREVKDNAIPSIFIMYDVTPYIELLPYMSGSRYIWTYDE